jgi:predicted transposase YdaD
MSIFEYDKELHIRLERQDAEEQGWRKGRMEGEYLMLIRLIRNMTTNGRTAEEIAELLDADLELIQHILALIKTHPDATNEMIYNLWADTNSTE